MLNFRKLFDYGSIDYPEDVKRIVNVARQHGEIITNMEANLIWRHYSDSMCAGWIILPGSDDLLWRALRYYFDQDDYFDEESEDEFEVPWGGTEKRDVPWNY